jgi:cytochrome c-type biogenesis protein CcmH/NrfG
MDALNKGLAMNPENPHAFFLLAGAYRRSNQFAKACLLYRMSAKMGGDKARCLGEARSCAGQIQARRKLPGRAAS